MIPVITEPATMLTDYVLAVLSLAFAFRIVRRAGGLQRRGVLLWFLAFGLACLAALVGGSYHGFRPYMSAGTHARVWDVTVWLIALGAVAAVIASVHSVVFPRIPPVEGRKVAHRWLWSGLFVTLVGVGVQQSDFGFHEHFNHNDIYHVIQMVGVYCLYRGALLLEGL